MLPGSRKCVEYVTLSLTLCYAVAGGIDRLFSNPYHHQQLHDWGLRPDTAVGCAMRFLFRPRRELFQGLDDLIRDMSDPRTLKIGLQVMDGVSALCFCMRSACT